MTLAVLYSYLEKNNNLLGITQDQFVYGSIGLIVLVMAVIYGFKRKALNKDALITLGTLGTIVLALIVMNHTADANQLFFVNSYKLREWYGFGIGAAFSGVIGVGFYPILGSRVWCRFGCPMAAVLGLQQRLFSKFRITTNGGQCISCGNCSVYCEMGIDVRAYAQRGEHIVRSSCVGCGICSAVCPRGVLKLENVATQNRMKNSGLIMNNPSDLLGELKKTL
jgi:polyferredoxin